MNPHFNLRSFLSSQSCPSNRNLDDFDSLTGVKFVKINEEKLSTRELIVKNFKAFCAPDLRKNSSSNEQIP